MRRALVLALVACSGDPMPPAAILEVERSKVDFGTVPTGRVQTRTLRIRNRGLATLVVGAVRAEGGPFEAVPAMVTLRAQDDADVRVRFAPEAPGRYEGTVGFESNDVNGSTITVALIGRAFCSGPACETADAGAGDAAAPDGDIDEDASLDAGLPDTGDPDAGLADTGDPDAGTPSVVAHYRFEEASGALIDSSDFGNDGAPAAAGLTRGVPGRVGNAVQLEGTVGQFVVQADPSLDTTSAMTIELFVSTAAVGNNMSIVSRGLDTGSDGWFVNAQCNNIHADFSRTGMVGTANATTMCNSLPDNDWIHVAIVNDGVLLTLYLDGNVAAQGFGGFLGPITAPLYIGRKEPGVEPYAGLIDELRISNVARTQDEICAAAGGMLQAGTCIVP